MERGDGDLTRTVTRGTALVTANTVFQKISGVATALLVTNALSVYAYGILRLVQTGIGTASLAFFPGLSTVMVAEAARARGSGDFGTVRALLSAYARFLSAVGVALFVLAVAAAFIVGPRWGQEGVVVILLSAGFLLLGAFSFLIPVILQSFLEFHALVRVRIVEQVGTLAAVAFVVYLGWRTVPAVLGAYLVAGLLGQVAAIPSLRRIIGSLRGQVPGVPFSFRTLIRERGIWSVFVDHTKTITDNARIWIITGALGVEAVALFALAEALFAHTVSLFPLAQVLLPAVSGEVHDSSRMRRVFIRSLKYHAATFALLALAGWTVFPPILTSLFPKYHAAIGLYQVMLIGLIFAFPAPTLNTYLVAYGRQKLLFSLMLARAAFVFIAIFAAIRVFGPLGMAVEYILSWLFFTYSRAFALLRAAPHLRFGACEFFTFDDFDRAAFSTLWKKINVLRRS